MGYVFILLGFLVMLLLWKENANYLVVGLAYSLVGIGIGLAGTPASRSLTGSVPVTRVGMASGTADLQRDLGGAFFNSLFGALLAAGYASAMAAALASEPDASQVPASVSSSLEMSYSGAQTMAAQYPQYASQITAAAKTSFLAGDQYAYIAGILAVLVGAALVFFVFPKHDEETEDADAISRRRRESRRCGAERLTKPTLAAAKSRIGCARPHRYLWISAAHTLRKDEQWIFQAYFTHLFSYLTPGNFVIIDLIAATTNALNGALLAQRPDYYRGKQWTVVGIILMAIFGGIGGGTARDLIAGKTPPAPGRIPGI